MSFKNLIQSHKAYVSIISILTLFFSLAAIQFSLLNILGFEYSIVHSILFVIVSGHSVIFLSNRKIDLTAILQVQFIFLLIPIIVGLINSFFVKNCSLIEGFEFYFLFTVISSIFGLSLGALVTSLIEKFQYLCFVFLFIFIFGWSLWIYYISPQLYLFNPIFGYFPGFVYDEDITLASTIVIYRVSILFISLFVILISSRHSSRKNRSRYSKILNKGLVIFTLLIICLMIYFSDELGFSTSISRLEKNFSKEKVDERFEFYFESDSVSLTQKKIVRLITAFHFEELVNFFQTQPTKIIKIFFFESNESKKRLLGTGSADFTKPWQYQIFLTRDNFRNTIKHELAHIFCGEYSENIFNVAHNNNLGLVEGAAMAAEWEWNEKEPHFYAANIFRYVDEINPSTFFRGFNFAFKPSNISYIISGSFARFIIDEFGIKKFANLYSSGDFENIYGLTLVELSKQYLKFIRSIKTYSRDSLSTLYYFKRQSIFEKECLRSIARSTKEAFAGLTEKKYFRAEKLFNELWKQVKTPSIGYGLLYSKLFQKKYHDCIDFFVKEIFSNTLEPSYVSAYLLTSYAYALTEQVEMAKWLLEYSLKLNLSPRYSNSTRFRLKLIESKELLEKYLFTNDQGQLANELLAEYVDNIIVMNQFHNYLKPEVKKKFLSIYTDNFWVFEEEFYNSLNSNDIAQAQNIVDVLNHAPLTEVEENKMQLMKFILSNILS